MDPEIRPFMMNFFFNLWYICVLFHPVKLNSFLNIAVQAFINILHSGKNNIFSQFFKGFKLEMRMTRQIENFHFMRVFVEFCDSIYHVNAACYSSSYGSPLSILFLFI